MEFTYTTVYSNRKTVSIIVERDRSIVVRAPLNTEKAKIEEIVDKKKYWIREKIEHYQKYPSVKQKMEFVSGESLLHLGKPYPLIVVEDDFEGVRFDNKFVISRNSQKRASEILHEWYFRSAAEVILPRAIHLANRIGVSYNKITIRDLKYRWGSCTPKDNIHFNWRLVKAPMNVAEYIIVHELTHLLEANHSQEFWLRVRAAYPMYPEARKWLKDSGHQLETDF